MTNVTKVSHNGASMQLVRSGIHSKTTWLKHGRKTMLIKAIYAAYILILMHFLCILKNYFKKKLSSPARWQNATAHTHTDTGCDTKQESGSTDICSSCKEFEVLSRYEHLRASISSLCLGFSSPLVLLEFQYEAV